MSEIKIVFVGGANWYSWQNAPHFQYVAHPGDVPDDADAVLVWSPWSSMWITIRNNLSETMPRIANYYSAEGIMDLLTLRGKE